jgi:hypothetical protein
MVQMTNMPKVTAGGVLQALFTKPGQVPGMLKRCEDFVRQSSSYSLFGSLTMQRCLLMVCMLLVER